MIFLNLITLTFLFFYLAFLTSKVIFDRLIEPKFLFAIVLFFYIIRKLINIFFIIYEKFSKKSLIAIKISAFFLEVKNFFDVEFLQKFLDAKFSFSLVFFKILRIYLIFLKKRYILFLFIFIPWFFFLETFFLEIFTQEFFFTTLYFLSLSSLLRFLLFISIFILRMKTAKSVRFAFLKYFPNFLEPKNLKFFFLINPMQKNHLLFNEKTLQTRPIIIFLWEAFQEIHFFHFLHCSVHFFHKQAIIYEKIIKDINLLLFMSSFILLLFNLDSYQRLGVVLGTLFISGLVIRNAILEIKDFQQKAKEAKEFETFLQLKWYNLRYFVKLRQKLLKTYSFLQKNDLRVFVPKSAKNLNLELNEEFSTFLTNAELQNLDSVTHRMLTWFNKQNNAGNIEI